MSSAQRVKDIEATTNHDVKAVEYFLKEAFAASGVAELSRVSEFLHFAATSEDVSNLAYALMLKGAREQVMLPRMRALVEGCADIAERLAHAPLMGRTQ
jgi:adenylosuccinate lyase